MLSIIATDWLDTVLAGMPGSFAKFLIFFLNFSTTWNSRNHPQFCFILISLLSDIISVCVPI